MSTMRFAWTFAFLALTYPLSAAPVKVACIGDSITEGSGLSNPTVESYPAKLQKLLGTNYIVHNYGVSGRTLLKKGDYPYWKEVNFTASHDWSPDIVIIQLGTNDGKPYNWKYGTNFVSDYEDMVAGYAALTSKPKVIACTPCPVYKNGAYDIQPGTIATNIAPAVRDIASRLGLELIDLNLRLAGHPEWFPDTVHPNTKGTTAMAAVICESLLGGYPTDPLPSVFVGHPVPNRVVLIWPSSWRGLIPQSTTALGLTNTTWSVAETVIYLDGDVMRQTNLVSGTSRIYRLIQP
jgi:lysophospholipase L1-like esterase